MELDKIYNMDCLEGLATLPDKCIDLVVTDPPYEITGTYHSGTNKLCKGVSDALTQLTESNIDKGFDKRVLDELWRVMKIPNIYIWCNIKQIPFYIKYFVEERGCSMEMLFWYKTNAMPLFGGKYLIDKEFCLYFRKGGYCNPKTYEEAKTVFFEPINAKDKKIWGHPTIKPLSMIDRLVRNSTKEGDIVLDPFMGSGTTAIAAIKEKCHFLGYELNPEFYEKANQRIQNEINTLKLFD